MRSVSSEKILFKQFLPGYATVNQLIVFVMPYVLYNKILFKPNIVCRNYHQTCLALIPQMVQYLLADNFYIYFFIYFIVLIIHFYFCISITIKILQALHCSR